MSLSDCEKCWDTPCTCGWEYRSMTRLDRARLAAVVLGFKAASPEADKLFAMAPVTHPMKEVRY